MQQKLHEVTHQLSSATDKLKVGKQYFSVYKCVVCNRSANMGTGC